MFTFNTQFLPIRLILALAFLSLLAACAGPKYTVDDGRQVNEDLLGNIRAYGLGERALRPAIARTAVLSDSGCDTQWELPFSLSSSYEASKDDRVAWVRGLGVDERLTVVAATADSPLQPPDKIEEIGGFASENSEKMLIKLLRRRDTGRAFEVRLATGKSVTVTPFEVCRGYARLASPNAAAEQSYHWLFSTHPLDVVRAGLSADEALWMVLWGQGVSEEGGVRMKAYDYGSTTIGTLYSLFTIGTGIQGASLAAEAAGRAIAKSVATDIITGELIGQAAAAGWDSAHQLSREQAVTAMQQSAANRASLGGVSWAAASVFEEADAWAYRRMAQLDANPLAAFSLHQKLIERGYTANAMVLDQERLQALGSAVAAAGKREEMVAILKGLNPEGLQPGEFDAAPVPTTEMSIPGK